MSVHIGFKLTFEILHKSLKLRFLLDSLPPTLSTSTQADDTSDNRGAS